MPGGDIRHDKVAGQERHRDREHAIGEVSIRARFIISRREGRDDDGAGASTMLRS